MSAKVLAIYPGFDPAINEMALAWEQCAAAGHIEFLALARSHDRLKNAQSKQSELRRERFSINWIPGDGPLRLDACIVEKARRFRPDIVVSGTIGNLAVARCLARDTGAKLVLHSEFFRTDENFIGRRKYLGIRYLLPLVAERIRSVILKQVDCVWVSDPVEGRSFDAHSGQLRYLPWPHPDPDTIVPAQTRDRNSIVYIGSICRSKGAQQLAAHFCDLLEAFPEKQIRIVGPAVDRTGKAALHKIADRAGSRLHYRPGLPRHEAMDLLGRAPFVFVPGARLSWGLIGDSWRRRTPVIVQNEHYDLKNNVNCIVVRNSSELIRTLENFDRDSFFAAHIVDAAEQTGRAHSPLQVANVMRNLIFEVLGIGASDARTGTVSTATSTAAPATSRTASSGWTGTGCRTRPEAAD